MGQLDRWLRRAASAAPDEVLLATLAGTTLPAEGARRRPCVLVATSGHVVHHVPRWRRPETVVVPLGELADVDVDDRRSRLTLTSDHGVEVVVDRIDDPVAVDAFVAVLDRHGRRQLPDDPTKRRPGHGHVTRISPQGR
jgi:hypothetical protein